MPLIYPVLSYCPNLFFSDLIVFTLFAIARRTTLCLKYDTDMAHFYTNAHQCTCTRDIAEGVCDRVVACHGSAVF